MKNLTFFLKTFLTISLVYCPIFAHEILINTQDGEVFILDVDPEETLRGLQEKVTAFCDGNEQSFLIEVPGKNEVTWTFVAQQGGYLGYARDYNSPASQAEKADIRFIVTYLANKSLISIAIAKGDLVAAGDRIDHVHPLRFLEAVFTDEELKVGIRNIRGKGWVWNHFVGGLKDSLSTEFNIGNIPDDYIIHFANSVGIDVNVIFPSIVNQRWDEFIDLLILKIPRRGDQDRYDC